MTSPARQNLAGNMDPSNEALANAKMVRYRTPNSRDDSLALRCRTPGDIVQLATMPGENGPAGLGDFGNVGKDGYGMAWFATSHGNRYGVARGQILDLKRGTLSRIDDAQVDIRVGGQVRVRSGTGQLETSNVTGVLFWQGQSDEYTGGRDINNPDVEAVAGTPPFEPLWKLTSLTWNGDAAATRSVIQTMQQERGFTPTN